LDWDQIRKDEKTLLEKEYNLHRWYRLQPESDFWSGVIIILTAVASFALGLSGYYYFTLAYNSRIIAAVIGITILAGGLLVNRNIRSEFYSLFKNRRSNLLDIHKNALYFFLEGYEDILFIQTEDKVTAFGIFEIKGIPLMIKGNFERFMKALYQQGIPVFWIYTQTSLEPADISQNIYTLDELSPNSEIHDLDQLKSINVTDPQIGIIRILFGLRKTFKITTAREEIYQEVSSKLYDIGTLFRSAYPHLDLASLKNQELHGAFNLIITCGAVPL